MKTLYGVLDIRPDADTATVQAAFRKAVKAHHPDLNAGDPKAAERVRRIIAAHAILRDEARREAYDRQLLLDRRQWRAVVIRCVLQCAVAAAIVSASILGGDALLVFDRTGERNHPRVDASGAPPPAVIAATALPAVGALGRDRLDAKPVSVIVSLAFDAIEASGETLAGGAPPIAGDEPPIDGRPNTANPDQEPDVVWPVALSEVDRAMAEFDQVILLAPADANAYVSRGKAWERRGDHDRALADYDQAIRIDPGNSALLHERGRLWQRRGALDSALIDLDRAIRFSFADARIYRQRGLVWYEKRRYDRALADLNRAIKLAPRYAEAYVSRSTVLHHKGDIRRAFADIGRAMRIDPDILDNVRRSIRIE
jgi:tetratricopeptide (TPR) repeat protein